ncbi:MAG: threonine synthase [Bacillota bacterium]|nr:threonine synthase [Bacillota bacterium]
MSYINCARCISCGQEIEALPQLTLCPHCGGLLDVVYDYPRISARFNRGVLANRVRRDMWRYAELLPVEQAPAGGLAVGDTPLYDMPRLAEEIGIAKLYIKDEGLNPTASMKDRASAMAVVKALEGGYDVIACSSTGNAASSLAGNAAAAGLKTYIFVPERAPQGKLTQLLLYGARVFAVRGDYQQTFRLSAEAIEQYGWYNRNAAINPYLLEGKKTVALEIAEQLQWQVPDYVAVAVGDGCTIAGVYKGFADLLAVGIIDRIPRLLAVQAEGCCPINTAYREQRPLEAQPENTLADSIAVGWPRNPDKALAAIRDSRGLTIEVSDEQILAAMRLLGRSCGIFGEPAGVAALAGLVKARQQQLIPADATVVHIVTGNGLKDIANGIKAVGQPHYVEPKLKAVQDILDSIDT